MIQRCQVHKKRNVKAHVPEKHHAELERRLSEAYYETGYEAAKASLEATARWLERINPDAASSLREGMEETLSVVRLGLSGALRRTLATTNPIESALSVTRRVKGHRAMTTLLKVLEGSAREGPTGTGRGIA